MKRTVPLLNDIVVRVSRKAIAVILFILVFNAKGYTQNFDSYTPKIVSNGTVVTITGRNFNGKTLSSVDGAAIWNMGANPKVYIVCTNWQIVDDNTIKVTIGAGNSAYTRIQLHFTDGGGIWLNADGLRYVTAFTINTQPTASNIVYGQTLANSTLSGGAASVPGTFTFTSPSIAPVVGTASQSYTFTPTDNVNYTTVNGTVNVTVTKATPNLTPTLGSYTYNGSAQGPVSVTGSYGTGGLTWSYAGSGSTSYGPTTTLPTNSGSYIATVSVASDANYNAGTSSPVAFSIGKASLSITANSQIVSYSTPSSTVTNSGSYTITGFVGTDNASVISGNPTYTTTYTASTTAGAGGVTITPVVSGLSTANYTFNAVAGNITVMGYTLDKLGLTNATTANAAYSLRLLATSYAGPLVRITTDGGTSYYDVYPDAASGGFSVNCKISAPVSSYNASVAAAGTSVLTTLITANTTNATVAIWYDQSGGGNNAIQGTIANQPAIIASGVIYTRNGIPAIYFNGSSTNLAQSTVNVSSSYTLNAVGALNIVSGSYQRLINVANTLDSYGFLGTLSGKYATFVGNGSSWNDLNANATAASVNANNAILSMVVSQGSTGLLPFINGVAQTAKNGTSAACTGLNIGGYYGSYNQLWNGYVSEVDLFASALPSISRVAMENNQVAYYFKPTIATQPATSSQSIVYGSSATTLTVSATTSYGTISGYQWYSSTSSSNSGGTLISGATTTSYTPPVSAVGTTYYYVVATNSYGSTVTSNVSGAVTVIAITPVVSPIIGTYTYNGSGQGPSSATNTGTGTSYTYSYAGTGSTVYSANATAPTAAGTYTVTATVSANGNYASASSSAVAFSITKAALTITATAQSKTYGSVVLGTAAFTTSGLAGSDAVSAVILTAAGAVNVGTYTIVPSSASGTGLPNYNITYANGALTINAAPLTITASAQSKTYSTALSLGTSSFSTSGLVGTDAISAVTLTSTGTVKTAAIGVYPIVPSLAVFSAGSSSNYAINYSNGTLTVNAGVTGIWVGLSSSDFNVLSNWQSYSVPTSVINVAIPAGTPYAPVLSAGTIINNLNLASGTTLGLNGQSFTINGAVTGIGTITSTSTSSLTLGGAAGTLNFTSGNNTILNLTLNSSAAATLGNQLNIVGGSTPGVVTIGSGATLTTGGNLVLKSDINGTARIPQSAGSISGNVTVERYIPAKASRKYTQLGSAVGGVTIANSWQQQIFITGSGSGGTLCGTANSNGFDATATNQASMFTYAANKINNSRWISVPNTNNTYLVPGIGYDVNIRGNRNSATVSCADQLGSTNPTPPEAVTLSASGTVSQGNVSVPLNQTTGANYSFTLVANPYPCPIDFTTFQSDNNNSTTGITQNMWLYSTNTSASGTHTPGNYTTYSGGVVTNAPTGYNAANLKLLESGQAFFVQSSSSSANTVTFKESHKITGTPLNNAYFGSNVLKLIRVGLQTISNAPLDEVVIRFNNYGNNSYNPINDAVSLNNGSQVLTALKGTSRLAISTLLDSTAADSAKLGIKSTSTGTFQLVFSQFNGIDSTKAITLVDKYLDSMIDIRMNQVYVFNVTSDTASYGNNRFEVLFGAASNTLPVNFTGITANMKGADVEVKWTVANQINIASYKVERSTDGVTFTSIATAKATGANTYTLEDKNLPVANTLYYRIKSIGADGSFKYSAIAKLTTNHSALTTIAIYPNPVLDKLNLSFKGIIRDNYNLRILTATGKEVYNRDNVRVIGKYLSLDLSSFESGIYMIELSNTSVDKIIQKFIKN